MSDDLQVKQGVNTQSGSGGYGLTGGVLGATASGLGAYYLTKPKYGTYSDIIAETKDSFEKKYTDVPEKDKNFIDATKEFLGKKDSILADYEAKFNTYKAAHENDRVQTEKYKELLNKLTSEKDADKINELNNQIAKLTENEKFAQISEEQLKTDFHKTLGENIKDQKSYINRELDNIKKDYIEKYAENLKRKWGFEGHTSWKIAGAAALGALVLGGLFNALSPKNKA